MAGPFTTGSPRPITYSPADDRTPAWLPDGSSVIYSSEQPDRHDQDRCLLVLPAGGGTVQRTICNQVLSFDDTTDRYESPAVGPDSQLMYVHVESRIGLQKGPDQFLMLGTLADPLAARVVSPIPYFASSGRTHNAVSQIHPAGPGRFVFLGQMLFYEGSTFLPDTFYTGLDVVVADVRNGASMLTVLPGTDYASGVAVDPAAPDVVYFTLGGDSRVYRQLLDGGAPTVVFDFGAGHIVRDAQVAGSRLVAVLDGSVLYQLESAHGYVQRDEGGDLAMVDLVSGSAQLFTLGSTLFRRPAISPAGDRFVVEASPRVPVHVVAQSDFTAINHRPDLWLFDLP